MAAAGDLAIVLPAPALSLSGTYDGPSPTDTSNGATGRIRGGGGYVVAPPPVAPVPADLGPTVVFDVALPYPAPVMVNGRPT